MPQHDAQDSFGVGREKNPVDSSGSYPYFPNADT